MLLDEFGKYLKSIAGAKAASHEMEITKIMMELYTSAGSVFSGMEYADHDGKMPRQQLVSPCLSMYPVTTPDRFYEAMTKGMRWTASSPASWCSNATPTGRAGEARGPAR